MEETVCSIYKINVFEEIKEEKVTGAFLEDFRTKNVRYTWYPYTHKKKIKKLKSRGLWPAKKLQWLQNRNVIIRLRWKQDENEKKKNCNVYNKVHVYFFQSVNKVLVTVGIEEVTKYYARFSAHYWCHPAWWWSLKHYEYQDVRLIESSW